MQKHLRLAPLVLLAVAAIVLGGVIYYKPFWGFMDDAVHIFTMVPTIERDGILRALWNYSQGDLAWGMFRPTYALMVYPLYKPGIVWGPSLTFFINALFALVCVGYCGSVLARIVAVRREWVLVGSAAFFYQYDLFQYPSLQEKLILIFGALFVRLAWGPLVRDRYTHFFLFAVVFLLGVFSKASFMIYFSMAIWAYFSAHKERLFLRREAAFYARLGAFLLIGFCAIGFFAFISARGGYTNQYSFTKVMPNLLSIDGALFVVPLGLFILWILKEPKLFLAQPERLTAFWGVLAFLVIFLPWGIKAYIQSVIGPVLVCLCVQLAEGFFSRIPQRVWQIPLAALALATAAYRIPNMFTRLHDIGMAVKAVPDWERQGVKEIFLSCWEGSDSMRLYAEKFAQSSLKVTRIVDFRALEGKAIFFDLALCPLPDRANLIPGCSSQEILFEGKFKKSFRLAKGKGCSG